MNSSSSMSVRLLSRPIPVLWAGMVGDTLSLQRNGWNLVVEHSAYEHSYTLLMKHEGFSCVAVTEENVLDYDRITSLRSDINGDIPPFHVIRVASDIHRMSRSYGVQDFKTIAIDARPSWDTEEIKSMKDLNVFKAFQSKNPEQIIIEKNADMSVIEHLQEIKRIQAPKQHELRTKTINGIEATEDHEVVLSLIKVA